MASRYPVDSVYSWFLSALCLLVYSAGPGTIRVLGIILIEMRSTHDFLGDAEAFWVTSIPFCLILLMGPTSGYLLTVMQIRSVAILGLFLGTVGFLITAYAASIAPLIIAFALLGIGFNYSFMPCVMAVSVYFDKHRGTALGITTAGAALGTLYAPPLSRFLFDTLSYREAVSWLAALSFQMCVPAMFIRPEGYWRVCKKDEEQNVPIEDGKFTNEAYTGEEESISTGSDVSSGSIKLESVSDNPKQIASTSADECCNDKDEGILSDSKEQELEQIKEMGKEVGSESVTRENERNSLKTTLQTLFKRKAYVFYLLSCFCVVVGYSIAYVLIPVFSEELSIPKYHVSTALAVSGGVELATRVLHGVIANRKYISTLMHVGICMICAGLGILILVVWPSVPAVYITSICCGIFFACLMPFVPLVVGERFDQKFVPLGTGLVYGFEGFSSFLSYGLSPYLHSIYGTWSAGLIFVTCMLSLGGATMIATSLFLPPPVEFKYQVRCRGATEDVVGTTKTELEEEETKI